MNCCNLCKPNNLEIEAGLNTCRITLCGCHFKPEETTMTNDLKENEVRCRVCNRYFKSFLGLKVHLSANFIFNKEEHDKLREEVKNIFRK